LSTVQNITKHDVYVNDSITSSDNTNVALQRTKFKSKHLTLHNFKLMTADLP